MSHHPVPLSDVDRLVQLAQDLHEQEKQLGNVTILGQVLAGSQTNPALADVTEAVAALVPAGRRLFFLEGGYDLRGLADSAGATLATLDVQGDTSPLEPVRGALGEVLGVGEVAQGEVVVVRVLERVLVVLGRGVVR